MRKQRERDCARRAAQTASERQATSQWKSTRERERTAAETPEKGKTRLQQVRDRLAASHELPSPQDVDPIDAHFA